MKRVLYLSYDGMTDQLGQSQVIPYLIGLSKVGYLITIISFEKENNYKKKSDTILNLLTQNNIVWEPLFYTKNPPILSTIYDLQRMKSLAIKLHRTKAFDVVHCRSYISALVGLFMKRKLGIRFIFDMRGFWADERVDGDLWNLKNPLYQMMYQYFKRKERQFFLEADYIISLTEAGRREVIKIIKPTNPLPIKVIPCCVDTELFSQNNIDPNKIAKLKKELMINADDFIISYLGAIGTWYMIDEMMQFFALLLKHKPNAKFLFITNESPKTIYQIANKYSIMGTSLIIREAVRNEVPLFLSLSQLSIFFIKPAYSKIASSPTKLGEIMSMGIPVICNSGVGDVVNNVGDCGAIINEFNKAEFEKVIQDIPKLLFLSPDKIRERAIANFSLEKGIKLYEEVYSEILL